MYFSLSTKLQVHFWFGRSESTLQSASDLASQWGCTMRKESVWVLAVGLLVMDKEQSYQSYSEHYTSSSCSPQSILSSEYKRKQTCITCWERHEVVTLLKVALLIQEVARVKRVWVGELFGITHYRSQRCYYGRVLERREDKLSYGKVMELEERLQVT